MGRLRKKIIGKRVFGSKVEVTDPCYSRDIWCKMRDVEIVPGEYTCVVWMHKGSYEYDGKTYDDTRVGNIGIYLGGIIPTQKSMVEIGTIGVDAGVAGFFENKPDYTEDEWDELCKKIKKGYAWIFTEGFFSESGFGDGGYPVYAFKSPDSGKITSLEIRFI